MIGRFIALIALGSLLSGCIMVPLALVGPAASGFSTASIMQSVASQSASYMIKKKTGKTIGQHAFDAINEKQQAFDAITNAELQSTYLPQENESSLVIIPQGQKTTKK